VAGVLQVMVGRAGYRLQVAEIMRTFETWRTWLPEVPDVPVLPVLPVDPVEPVEPPPRDDEPAAPPVEEPVLPVVLALAISRPVISTSCPTCVATSPPRNMYVEPLPPPRDAELSAPD